MGTYKDIAHAKVNAPLIDILNTFVQRRISSIPVMDEEGKVVDVCEKYDILVSFAVFPCSLPCPAPILDWYKFICTHFPLLKNLARESSYYDLDMSVNEALKRRSSVEFCPRSFVFMMVNGSI